MAVDLVTPLDMNLVVEELVLFIITIICQCNQVLTLFQLVAVDLELVVLVLVVQALLLVSTVRLELAVVVAVLVVPMQIQVDVEEEELTQAHLVDQLQVLLVGRIMQTLRTVDGEILVLQVLHQEVDLVVVLGKLALLDEVLQVEQDYHLV